MKKTELRVRLTILCVFCAFCGKSQVDRYRPKIAEFSFQQINDSEITANSELYGNGSSEIENDVLWNLKLGVPVIMKDDKLLAVQLSSRRHKFYFDTENLQANYELFNEINRRTIMSSGVRLLYKQDLSTNSEFCFFSGLDLKSDRFEWNPNSSQYYFGSIYTVKKNSRTKIGGGFVVGSDLGVFSLSPIFLYQRTFNEKWTLDLKLPKYVSLRHRLNEKSYLIGKIEGQAWRYNLTDAIQTQDRELSLRRIDVRFTIDYEREIHDWLWFGVSAGYSKNLNYYLANPGERSRNALFQLNARSAPVTQFSLFIVPPKKFYK